MVIVFLCCLPFSLSLENVKCSAEYWFSANFSAGYNTVVRIPAGATSLDVRQHSFSGKSEDDNYLGKSLTFPWCPNSESLPGAAGTHSFLPLVHVTSFLLSKKMTLKFIVLFLLLNSPSEYWLKGYIITVFNSKGFAPYLTLSEFSVESWVSWSTLKTSVWVTDLQMFS